MCQAPDMDELCVSVSHFRVHLKDLANTVAAGERRILVSRHGFPMVALVSQEDLAFLREHRPRTNAAREKVPEIPEVLEHPECMPFEEVERLYRLTKGMTGLRIADWRGKAWLHIKLTTGEFPADDPWPSSDRDAHPEEGRPRAPD